MSPETVAEVRSLIQNRESKSIDVTTPRGRLEHLFLRIVKDAQTAKVATSGVGEAGAIPDFLGTATSTGEEIIQSLLEATEKPPTPEPIEIETPQAAEPSPSEEVLTQLLDKSRTEEKKIAPPSADKSGQT